MFLGGTGKYVAELQRGWSASYGWAQAPFIAFDVDASEDLSGAFALGPALMHPPINYIQDVRATISSWNGDDLAKELGTGSRTPEDSVLLSAARDLSRPVLVAGAGLWTLRAIGLPAAQALAAGGPQGNVVERVRRIVQPIANGGGPVHILIVGSAAGGTGSGFLTPLALWLRHETAAMTNVRIYGIIALASAFENSWNAADQVTRSKGKAGTFGVFREVALLSKKPEPFARPGERKIGLQPPLTYWKGSAQPLPEGAPLTNYPLFDGVFWFGRREVSDADARATAIFEETARSLGALSDPTLSDRVAASPVMGNAPLALVPGYVSVEYRRLEVAYRLAGQVLEQTLRNRVAQDTSASYPSDAQYSYHAAQLNYPFAAFVRSVHSQVFAHVGGATGGTTVSRKQFRDFVTALDTTNNISFASPTQATLVAPAADWNNAVAGMVTDLDQRLKDLSSAQELVVRSRGLEELEATDGWMRERVESLLNAPGPLSNAGSVVKRWGEQLAEARTFFQRTWDAGLQANDSTAAPILSVPAAEAALQEAKQAMNPVAGPAASRRSRWDSIVRYAGCAFLGLIAGAAGYLFVNWFAGLVGFAVLGGLALFFTRPRARQSGPSLPNVRTQAFNRLREAYQELLFAKRAEFAWQFARTTLYAELANTAANEPTSRVQALEDALITATDMVVNLADTEQSKVAAQNVAPNCVVAEVGRDQPIPNVQLPELLDQLRKAAAFRVSRASGPVVTLELPAEQVSVVGTAADLGESALATGRFLDAFEARARTIVQEAGVLEPDFLSVPNAQQQLPQLLDRLGAQAIARGPSASFPGAGAPDFSVLAAGSPALAAALTPIVQNPPPSIQPANLARLRAGLAAGNQVLTVPSVGEGFALIEVWGAGDPEKLAEYQQMQAAYYGLGMAPAELDPSGLPQVFNAANFSFQVVPELATAAFIETAGHTNRPLHRLVVQRLRGCDPRVPGPSFLELYYIARVRGWLNTQGQAPATRTEILIDSVRVPLLVQAPVGAGFQDPAGASRRRLCEFDALADLLSYRGVAIAAGMLTEFVGAGQTLDAGRWPLLHQQGTIPTVQQALRDAYWAVASRPQEIQQLFEAMRSELEKDADGMEDSLANDWRTLGTILFDRSVTKTLR